MDNPKETNKLIKAAALKAESGKGSLEEVFEDLQLMFNLVKDWLSGQL